MRMYGAHIGALSHFTYGFKEWHKSLCFFLYHQFIVRAACIIY
uniref:Uncharacterized protein n=1 Tax=Picea glauca TaxID=3330 RepID=A0A101LZM5_PICGL|nr:hypothetical protein ABT39_MTgene5316 [Picea glauca]